MEQLLLASFEKGGRPQTFSELMSDLPDVQTSASEVEKCLESLVKRGELVCKTVNFRKAATDSSTSGSSEGDSCCTLYWRAALPDKGSSVFATPAKPSSSSLLTTPRSGMRPPSAKSRLPFKSPARVGGAAKPSPAHTPLSSVKHTPHTSLGGPHVQSSKSCRNVEQIARDVSALRMELEEVEGQITELNADSCSEDELQLHIDALHEYNEVKDVGQMLLGKIAELEGTTTTSLYERFGLDLDN